MIRLVLILGISFLILSCATTRLERYERYIKPRLDKAKKKEMDAYFGKPIRCRDDRGLTKCEYRTAVNRNDPIPSVHTQAKGFGPDLSPYDYYDVIHLSYDAFGILKEWQTTVVKAVDP